ncbi:MAG: hypothetical protein WCA08_20225 [Desulfoferrobacter sp.]
MKEQRERSMQASSRYIPTNPIQYLLIGESPPISGSYFYIPEDIRRKAQSLPAKVFRSFLGIKGGVDKHDYEKHLLRLGAMNFFLIDLSTIPTDAFAYNYRKQIIVAEFHSFCTRYAELNLSANVKKLVLLPGVTLRVLENGKDGFFENLLDLIKIEKTKICTWGNVEQKISTEWVSR